MTLSEELEQERLKLKQLFNEHSSLTQREFAKRFKLGSPANLGHYLNGRNPLNIEAAIKIAQGLGIQVSEFSPRLAKKISELNISLGNVQPIYIKQKKIPLFSYVQAGALTNTGQISSRETCIESGDFVYVDEN